MEGQQVYEFLTAKLDERRERAATLQAEVAELDQRVTELISRRGKALIDLARHYLPEMTQAAISNTFAPVRDDLQAVLKRKHRRQKIIDGDLEQEIRRRNELEQQIATVRLHYNDNQRQQEPLEEQLSQRLKENGEFQKLVDATLHVDQQLARDKQRVEELRQQALEKVPAYENSELFQYLYRRRYGFPEYAQRGITRRLDRWVAGLIDYGRARQSYEFLRVTPELLAAEVERRQDEFDDHRTRMRELESQIAQELGLAQLVQQCSALQSQQQQAEEELLAVTSRTETLEHERRELDTVQGEFYDQAIERFRQFLTETETAVLEARARRTDSPTDDEIVAEIKWLDEQTSEIQNNIHQLHEQLAENEEHVNGLNYVITRCRQSDISSQRCFFDDEFEPSRHVDLFFAGAVSRHDLLRAIRRHLQFRPGWSDKVASDAEALLGSETSQALLHALASVAGEALKGIANKSGRPPR
mgnify:CR=1 FL=1